ncbi:hypothetical protein BKA56DRAFT_14630 [Ilyonectria sp. MPI-CAGE-AT-0026]|nr:hypothetical protein BKA56DRAFT_14630 [Ilyonectria sp. MPI-CAGE-AT-0026]
MAPRVPASTLLPLLSPLVGSLGRGVSPKACKVARCMQEEAERGRERKKKKDGEADDGFKHHTHSHTHTKAIDEIKLLMLIGNRDLGEPTQQSSEWPCLQLSWQRAGSAARRPPYWVWAIVVV